MQDHNSRRLYQGLAAALLTTTSLVFAPLAPARAQDANPSAATPKPGAIQPTAPAAQIPDFVDLVKQVKPAVVSITSKMTESAADAAEGGGGPQQGMPFPFPFAMPQQQQRHAVEARGSGFIIDASGVVVTNNHVVNGASSVTVTLDDGTTLPAKVIGKDAKTDLAVLQVKSNHKLPFINLGDSGAVQPGEWVVAVGNPFGLGGTVTAGIVSARGRDIGSGPYDSFLQIDAPINQGNSGGPLFTQDGKVVGVNSQILTPSGGSVGIGFAIPSNLVRSVITQLEKTGHVTRGYLGVQAQGVNAAMATAMKVPAAPGGGSDHGALVASVEQDGPASHADIQPGDVIIDVNDKPIATQRDLSITVAELTPGSSAAIRLVRDGSIHTQQVTIGTLPGGSTNGLGGLTGGAPSLGLVLGPITPEMRQQLDLPAGTHGAAITDVTSGSPAEQAGLQPGDILMGIGDKMIGNSADGAAALRAATKAGQPVALRILRDGQLAFIAISPTGSNGQAPSDEDNGG